VSFRVTSDTEGIAKVGRQREGRSRARRVHPRPRAWREGLNGATSKLAARPSRPGARLKIVRGLAVKATNLDAEVIGQRRLDGPPSVSNVLERDRQLAGRRRAWISGSCSASAPGATCSAASAGCAGRYDRFQRRRTRRDGMALGEGSRSHQQSGSRQARSCEWPARDGRPGCAVGRARTTADSR